jgi:homogentisate 1,2-dioxygenase
MDTHGRNAIDFGVFRGRWDVTEHTFRPPYFHRNSAIEFNGVIKMPANDGPWQPGSFTYTPYLTPHGISATGASKELERTEDEPHRMSDESLWMQFESTYPFRVMPWMLEHPARDERYLEGFTGYPEGALP